MLCKNRGRQGALPLSPLIYKGPGCGNVPGSCFGAVGCLQPSAVPVCSIHSVQTPTAGAPRVFHLQCKKSGGESWCLSCVSQALLSAAEGCSVPAAPGLGCALAAAASPPGTQVTKVAQMKQVTPVARVARVTRLAQAPRSSSVRHSFNHSSSSPSQPGLSHHPAELHPQQPHGSVCVQTPLPPHCHPQGSHQCRAAGQRVPAQHLTG